MVNETPLQTQRLTRSLGQAPSMLRRRSSKLQVQQLEATTLQMLTQERISNKKSTRQMIRLKHKDRASSQLSRIRSLACIKVTALLFAHLRESSFYSRVPVKCDSKRPLITSQHYLGFSKTSSEIQMHLHQTRELPARINFFIPETDLILTRS